MAVPFATQQLIRIVTEKVLENLTRQAARALPTVADGPEAPPGATASVEPSAFNQLARYVGRIETELDDLKERHNDLERKVWQLEQRAGWRAKMRMALALVIAFLLGMLVAVGAHFGGWY